MASISLYLQRVIGGCLLGKKSSGAGRPRIPHEAAGIQVNFCKNPACKNFGVPAAAKLGRYRVGHARNQALGESYSITGTGKGTSALKCLLCGEMPSIKSNLAIAEEYFRLRDYLKSQPEPSCPASTCVNHRVGIRTFADGYKRSGKTHSGSQRYRCKSCGTTFAVGKSTRYQKRPHKNKQIFMLLMNKSPFRRIIEVAGISAPTLYKKIDFFYEQCRKFAANRERALLEGMELRRLNIAVDRQDYVVNWTQREDKRNVVLHAVGSADNDSGYVFGMHLNFDSSLDRDTIEVAARLAGDYEIPDSFRLHARVWLQGDYDRSLAEFIKRQAKRGGARASLDQSIAATYAEALSRSDVEVAEVKNPTVQLPKKGMQVHSEYTLYAHFRLLRDLLGGVGKVNFYLDQDSGMRAACLAMFEQEIKSGNVDAFYVRLAKEFTVPEKQAALTRSRAEIYQWQARFPDLTPREVEFLMIREQMRNMRAFGKWNDRWLTHPFPNMSEPEKAVCYLTDRGETHEDHLAWMYYKASLHSIDRFFMQVRRRLSLLERAIGSASTARRMWYGYSAYNPEMIVKLLDIFRVYYNYCLAGKDDGTPSMRLGISKGISSVEDIIYL